MNADSDNPAQAQTKRAATPENEYVGHVLVAARNEADRIAETVRSLHAVFTSATVIVADDGSTDNTRGKAAAAGAVVVSAGRHLGKGQAASLAAASALNSHRSR